MNYVQCRINFLIAYLVIESGDGVRLSGSTVQLITLGLLKGSLLSTCIMLAWVMFQD